MSAVNSGAVRRARYRGETPTKHLRRCEGRNRVPKWGVRRGSLHGTHVCARRHTETKRWTKSRRQLSLGDGGPSPDGSFLWGMGLWTFFLIPTYLFSDFSTVNTCFSPVFSAEPRTALRHSELSPNTRRWKGVAGRDYLRIIPIPPLTIT